MLYPFRAMTLFTCLSATTVLLTTGCIKMSIPIPPPVTTPPPSTPPTSNGPFSATFAGAAWAANYYTAIYYQSQGVFQIQGVADGINGDSTYVQIMFNVPAKLDQTIVSGSNPLDIAYNDLLEKAEWDAGESSGDGVCYLNITSYDSTNHKIAGSFYGSMNNVAISDANASDTINVKNGSFNLAYTPQP